MKWKEYETLIKEAFKYQELFSLMQISEDGSVRASSYNETKQNLEKYKSDIDSVLTMEMGEFSKYFLKFMSQFSDKEYVIEKIGIGDDVLHVAHPKDSQRITDSSMLDSDDVYVLGLNDKKILSHTTVNIRGVNIPTMAVSCPELSYMYPKPPRAQYEKYYKFTNLMKKLEEKTVSEYKKKLTNKR